MATKTYPFHTIQNGVIVPPNTPTEEPEVEEPKAEKPVKKGVRKNDTRTSKDS